MSNMNMQAPWGTYAPPPGRILRAIVTFGLAHGFIRKKIIASWKRQYNAVVDIETRGIKYRLNISDNYTDARIFSSSKIHDREEVQCLIASTKGNFFVDIGANIGYYLLTMAQNGAKHVLAIEPHPTTLERLNFNIRANHFENAVTVLPIGVGEVGNFELFCPGELGSSSLIQMQKGSPSVTIKTRPLQDMLRANGIDKIGGLKIDIEGWEDRALGPFFNDAPESMRPNCIVIEHSLRQHWRIDIVALILQKGYRLAREAGKNTILIADSNMKRNG